MIKLLKDFIAEIKETTSSTIFNIYDLDFQLIKTYNIPHNDMKQFWYGENSIYIASNHSIGKIDNKELKLIIRTSDRYYTKNKDWILHKNTFINLTNDSKIYCGSCSSEFYYNDKYIYARYSYHNDIYDIKTGTKYTIPCDYILCDVLYCIGTKLYKYPNKQLNIPGFAKIHATDNFVAYELNQNLYRYNIKNDSADIINEGLPIGTKYIMAMFDNCIIAKIINVADTIKEIIIFDDKVINRNDILPDQAQIFEITKKAILYELNGKNMCYRFDEPGEHHLRKLCLEKIKNKPLNEIAKKILLLPQHILDEIYES